MTAETTDRVAAPNDVVLIRAAAPLDRPQAAWDAAGRILAALLLLLLLPVMLLIVIAVRATSPGPAVFRQVRIGRSARPFVMLKFRTMRDGAEREVGALSHLNECSGPLFKVRRDPRLSTVGGWLRRFSLDELPQLWNVVRGDMALVGPRPPLQHEVAAYPRVARRRLDVKPGMTGLWQVSGRSDLPWHDAVNLDLWYVANRSVAVDLRILARTPGAVLRGAGAY